MFGVVVFGVEYLVFVWFCGFELYGCVVFGKNVLFYVKVGDEEGVDDVFGSYCYFDGCICWDCEVVDLVMFIGVLVFLYLLFVECEVFYCVFWWFL